MVTIGVGRLHGAGQADTALPEKFDVLNVNSNEGYCRTQIHVYKGQRIRDMVM